MAEGSGGESPEKDVDDQAQLLCTAVYDPPRDSAGRMENHTCDRGADHDGLHHCEICGKYWLARVGVREWAIGARQQVERARADAVKGGIGFVRVTRSGDGERFVYQRVDPEMVQIHARGAAAGGGSDRGSDGGSEEPEKGGS